MNWGQDQLIFPTHAVGSPGPLPRGAQTIEIDAASRVKLHGVYIPPARSANERILVLGFGGNAWNGADVAAYLHHLYPTAHVVTFHYRGYRPSTGSPSAEALIGDAPVVFDAAVERVDPDQVVVVGFSIGSGIGASLANRRPMNGLILVTPFDSLKAVAQDLYPWLPVGLLFQHEIDSARFLERAKVPVAVVAAEHDQIVPAGRTAALRPKIRNLVYDRTIANAGHNDIYGRADFEKVMREAFAVVVDAG
ncbi:MAG TPA: alpha/beta fold hydrolase [Sphingomicrobium sp.]|nr:alpha/beta fold hydrolase [Sphingomicrobium sp.]